VGALRVCALPPPPPPPPTFCEWHSEQAGLLDVAPCTTVHEHKSFNSLTTAHHLLIGYAGVFVHIKKGMRVYT